MTTATHPFPPEGAEKRLIALRFWMLGKGYIRALRALEVNRQMFTGLRKDGLTPEFDHHVVQAQYMRTLLPHLLYPEETLCAIFFHDTPKTAACLTRRSGARFRTMPLLATAWPMPPNA